MSIKMTIIKQLQSVFKPGSTIKLDDIYSLNQTVSKSVIREMMRRLVDDGSLLKVKPGVFQVPRKTTILKKAPFDYYSALNALYLIDKQNNRKGYTSGFSIANSLGLTTQTASVETVYSNGVAKKKREVIMGGFHLVVNAPRVKVNKNNFKLLQILDLLIDFDRYSEYTIDEVKIVLVDYLKDIQLDVAEIEDITSKYPLKAQLLFLKSGLQHAITSK